MNIRKEKNQRLMIHIYGKLLHFLNWLWLLWIVSGDERVDTRGTINPLFNKTNLIVNSILNLVIDMNLYNKLTWYNWNHREQKQRQSSNSCSLKFMWIMWIDLDKPSSETTSEPVDATHAVLRIFEVVNITNEKFDRQDNIHCYH